MNALVVCRVDISLTFNDVHYRYVCAFLCLLTRGYPSFNYKILNADSEERDAWVLYSIEDILRRVARG